MNSILKSEIQRAKHMVHEGDVDGAMQLANGLIAAHKNEVEVWTLRGYLHERADNHAAATADLTHAIALNASEPHLFYTRGRYRFQLRDNSGAVQDFDAGLELCNRLNNNYYRAELHFWRAEALIRLGKVQEALVDISQVSDDHQSWTYELRTKRDLLRDCRA